MERGRIAPFFISLVQNIARYEPTFSRLQADHYESGIIQVFCIPKTVISLLGRSVHGSF